MKSNRKHCRLIIFKRFYELISKDDLRWISPIKLPKSIAVGQSGFLLSRAAFFPDSSPHCPSSWCSVVRRRIKKTRWGLFCASPSMSSLHNLQSTLSYFHRNGANAMMYGQMYTKCAWLYAEFIGETSPRQCILLLFFHYCFERTKQHKKK